MRPKIALRNVEKFKILILMSLHHHCLVYSHKVIVESRQISIRQTFLSKKLPIN